MDVPTTLNDPNVPTPVEEGNVAAMRQKLLDRVNVSGLVPIAVANGMLVVGVNVDPVLDCHFGLTFYLIVAGTLSLAMVILNAINRIVVTRMVSDNMISVREKKVIKAIEALGKFMMLLEGLCLFGGLFFIYGNLKEWQYTDPRDKDTYCVFGEVVFSAIFVGMTNLFLGLGIAARVFIWFESRRAKKEIERRNLEEAASRIPIIQASRALV